MEWGRDGRIGRSEHFGRARADRRLMISETGVLTRVLMLVPGARDGARRKHRKEKGER
jgi:hypothetical protein